MSMVFFMLAATATPPATSDLQTSLPTLHIGEERLAIPALDQVAGKLPISLHRPDPDAATQCAISRLGPFVTPMGIRQSWPVIERLPRALERDFGVLFPQDAVIFDGYQHSLVMDLERNSTFIIEVGGFTGTTRIYGPLPLPQCATVVDAATSLP